MISDDVEVIRILTDQGVLDKLVPTPSEPANNQASTCFERGDHWCLATRHWGCPVETDNGYLLVAVPKSGFTREEATKMFADLLYDTSESKEFSTVFHEKTKLKNQ